MSLSRTFAKADLPCAVAVCTPRFAVRTASEKRLLSAYAAASVRRNFGSSLFETTTASRANLTALEPSRIDPSEDVASTQARLLRQWGSSAANAHSFSECALALLSQPSLRLGL